MSLLRQGETLSPRFRLIALLGRGGMGEVWLAWDEELDERVALKVVHPKLAARDDIALLLRQECRNTRRLVHPNIVRVYDFHRDGGHVFISMEHIEGGDLFRLQGAACRAVLQAVLPVANALAYAHGLGIIHRDVKASNILLDAAGAPHLADFGIAAAIHAGDGSALRTGGSPHGMSPQQAAGEPPQPGDDVYALGALLHILLTGRPPSLEAGAIPQPIPASDDRPQALDGLVLRMLAPSPASRPPSMEAVSAQLVPLLTQELHETLPPPPTKAVPGAAEAAAGEPLIGAVAPSEASPTPPAPRVDGRKTVPARVIIPGLVVLIAAVLGVFFLLPRLAPPPQPVSVTERQETTPALPGKPSAGHPGQAPAEETSGPTPASPEAIKAAEGALASLLSRQTTLEGMGVSLWGGSEFEAAKAMAVAGDEALQQGDYATAARHYREAVGLLEALAESSHEVLEAALERGHRALDTGDDEAARSAFNIAQAIEPENGAARHGLARAENVQELFRLLGSGEAHEQAGRLAFSHTDFDAALRLDPDSARAQAAVARVKARIAQEKFQSTMSEGLGALQRGAFKEALAAFREARRFQPDSPEVSDGITQATEGIRLSRIAALRAQAESREAQEHWADALSSYNQVLDIDPNLVFAQVGKARTLKLARTSAKMAYYVGRPERLTTKDTYEKASALLEQASAIRAGGPKWQAELSRFRKEVVLAGTPLTVEFLSDEATEVVVYKVGRLGQFRNRLLSLRPGTYTVVGSRPGYRDVRRELRLVAGRAPPPMVVACEERI